ncbi:Ku protein [Candidatus Parcubacteria bacterium]|nr:Ku protein [Candidatus Parcubacteria bacterium]
MRAIWTGSLSFGLVNIPVRLYSGAESGSGLDLNMLHKQDLSPIRYAKICRADGKEVAYEDIVKGYEYQKGDYVVLTDEDFKRANAKKTKTIEISEFTGEDEIDIRYFEKPYYLEPDKGAEKPYALLREALNRSKKVAIAKFVLRNREHIAAIKPVGKALVLNQMRFTSEIREPSGLKLPDEAVAGKEVDMALALIEQLTEPFIPEDFHDTYTEELEKVVRAKAKGKQPAAKGQEPENTQVKDLMAALKASLEQEKAKTGARK